MNLWSECCLSICHLSFSSPRSNISSEFWNQKCLNWQHRLCKNPRPNPDIKTLFVDHACVPSNEAQTPPANSSLVGALSKGGEFPAVGAHIRYYQSNMLYKILTATIPTCNHSSKCPCRMDGEFFSSSSHTVVAAAPSSLVSQPHPDSKHLVKRIRPSQTDEVSYPAPIHPPSMYLQEIPKIVSRTFNQGSNVMSMDFHPLQPTILLVGTNVGNIGIWDCGSHERLAVRAFSVWDISSCSMSPQVALFKDPGLSINRCIWSPDGTLLGAAFSKHVFHLYSYTGGGELRQHLEIYAHVGGVKYIAFAHPNNKQLCVITCGDDKAIKVWDAVTGTKQYTFEGHEAPVYSVCPHHKENIQFIFSTAIDGKIKAWLYDLLGSRVNYDAPGHWCTTMTYSADGTWQALVSVSIRMGPYLL